MTGVTGPTGNVLLNNQLPVQTTGVTTLTLNGLAGDNTFGITATTANPLPFTVINVNGSGLPDRRGEPDRQRHGTATAAVNMGAPAPKRPKWPK